MSDSDMDMMSDDEIMEDYDSDMGSASGSDMSGSDSGSDSEEDDPAIDLENQYYTATDHQDEGELEEALAAFKKAVEMEKQFLEEEKVTENKWSFKSLEAIVLLNIKLGKKEDIVPAYEQLLKYKGDDVNDNLLTKAISKILDQAAGLGDAELESSMYDVTGEATGSSSNKRIWFKTTMKKATAALRSENYSELMSIVRELEDYVKKEGGKSDQLLDVYSLEIQMYMAKSDKVGVKNTYEKALQIVQSNPGTLTSKLPIFQFCGGKIQMEDRQFDEAYGTLFDAFKYYVDIGSELRIPCLKYMLMANMLKEQGEKINPFDSKEVSHMRNHKEIEPIAQLLDAYERNNIRAFERILRDHPKDISDDSFLTQFVQELLTKVRIAKILELVKPYTRIQVQFLATQLTIDRGEVEELLVGLILDNKVEGKIDQINHVLQLEGRVDSATRYRALNKWARQIHAVNNILTSNV